MMTAARPPVPLDRDAISEREFAKLKQKVERLDKFFRVRILRGSPEEEVGAWSYHCFHHEESFTDKRHNTIIVAPGHRDSIKNKTTDPWQMGTAFVIVPADGSFATALAKDNHKEGEIQGQIRQHSSSINTVGEGQTRIGVNRIEQVGSKKGIHEISNEIRSVLIKIGANGFDHGSWRKGCRRKVRQGQTQASLWCRDAEDHRNETGSSGEPSSELWTSSCSTSLTQW